MTFAVDSQIASTRSLRTRALLNALHFNDQLCTDTAPRHPGRPTSPSPDKGGRGTVHCECGAKAVSIDLGYKGTKAEGITQKGVVGRSSRFLNRQTERVEHHERQRVLDRSPGLQPRVACSSSAINWPDLMFESLNTYVDGVEQIVDQALSPLDLARPLVRPDHLGRDELTLRPGRAVLLVL